MCKCIKLKGLPMGLSIGEIYNYVTDNCVVYYVVPISWKVGHSDVNKGSVFC